MDQKMPSILQVDKNEKFKNLEELIKESKKKLDAEMMRKFLLSKKKASKALQLGTEEFAAAMKKILVKKPD